MVSRRESSEHVKKVAEPAEEERMRPGHVRVDDIAEKYVVAQVGVTEGVDQERIPDAAPFETVREEKW